MFKFYKGGIYKMYIFNRVTVVPKLPKRIEKTSPHKKVYMNYYYY